MINIDIKIDFILYILIIGKILEWNLIEYFI